MEAAAQQHVPASNQELEGTVLLLLPFPSSGETTSTPPVRGGEASGGRGAFSFQLRQTPTPHPAVTQAWRPRHPRTAPHATG
jgi:hypothetical protein